jgi:hypothetical protein
VSLVNASTTCELHFLVSLSRQCMLHFSVSLPELSTHLDYSKSKMTSDQFPKAPPVQCLSDLQDLDWTANPGLHETPRRSCNAGCDWAAITVLWVDEAFMVHDSCTTRYTALYIMHAHINSITIRSSPQTRTHCKMPRQIRS